jgi:phosphatidylinositol alpha-mannosyltransferase
MRIAIVCPYDFGAFGGVQRVVGDLVERLRSGGDDAFAVGPGVTDEMGVDVGRSVMIPGNGSMAPIALGPEVRRRVRAAVADCDVVHVHEPLMPMASLAALGAGRPTVATFHAAVAPWTSRLYRALDGVGARLLRDAALTAVSPMAMAALPDAWSPVTIIPNGIDVASFGVDVARVPGRIVMVGRDEPRKGIDVMLGAFGDIRSSFPDAELHVIGADRPAADGVVYHGRVRDREKRELLASSQIYVAPHLGGESFGIVLAEAMAAGCAVVASDLAAFRSVGGDAAEYFAVGDSVSLAREVRRLLSAPGAIDALADAGEDRVQIFDWGLVVARYRAVYERMANIGNAPGSVPFESPEGE